VEAACEKYRKEHPGSKRYPPWQRKDIDDLSIVKEDSGSLSINISPWSESEIQALGTFLQSASQAGMITGTKGAKSDNPVASSTLKMPPHVSGLLFRVHEAQADRFRERFGNMDESMNLLTAAALAHAEKYAPFR
jgi:hypothetical protein